MEADRGELLGASPRLCLEIGSGSGCVIAFLGQLMAPLQPACLAVDINPAANRASQATGQVNGVCVDAVRTSLAQGLRLGGLVDILVFNPPYVPTEEAPSDSPAALAGASEAGLLAAAWAGGHDGRYWIDRLIPQIDVPQRARVVRPH